MPNASDILYCDCHAASMRAGTGYGIVRDAAIAVKDGQIKWVGPEQSVPAIFSDMPRRKLNGRWVLPALIDCHTHLVYAGNRANEFEQRLQGASYAEIAKAGGGIISTVKATRSATLNELVELSLPRAQALVRQGVGTVEVKSGYGLDVATEIKMLQAAQMLCDHTGLQVHKTLLAAHAVPPEFANDPDGYIDLVTQEIMPEAKSLGLVDSVDAFCEGIGFTSAQTRKVFARAKQLGLPIRLHAEQLSNLHGAQMAAEMGALSCDHLEYLDEDGIAAMAASGSIAVLLPGAFYFLHETMHPPVSAMRKAGVKIAIATDCNPGSSPTTNILLMLSFACNFFGLTPEEALEGVTCNAASALGLGQSKGQIAPEFDADLVAWNIEHPNVLAYAFGETPKNERL